MRVKRDSRVLALIMSIILLCLPAANVNAAASFPDIVSMDDKSIGYIEDLYTREIIGGFNDGTFGPYKKLNRAQAAKMIVNAAGLSTQGKTSSFNDVPKNDPNYPYISAAYEAGIIKGKANNNYKPYDNVSRSQISKMVTIAFGLEYGRKFTGFADIDSLEYDMQYYIDVLASHGIVKGYSGNLFKPHDSVNRSQFAKILSLTLAVVETEERYLPLEFVDYDGFADDGWMYHSIILHNPSDTYAYVTPSIRFTAYDAAGYVLGTTDNYLPTVYPGQDIAYSSLAFQVDGEVDQMEWEILPMYFSDIVITEALEHPDFLPLEIETVSVNGDRVLGKVYNTNNYYIDDALVTILFRDVDGRVTAMDTNWISDIPADGAAPFDSYIYAGEVSDNYEIYVSLNFYD